MCSIKKMYVWMRPNFKYKFLDDGKNGLKQKLKDAVTPEEKRKVMTPIFEQFLAEIVSSLEKVSESYEYNQFCRGDYSGSLIRCIAASERQKSINLKTELVNDVKITNMSFSAGVCTATIEGTRRNVEKAKEYLNMLLADRIDKFKKQLIPYIMHKYCKNKDILLKSNPLWAHFRVEMIVGVKSYKNSSDYLVEIAGSSKSV